MIKYLIISFLILLSLKGSAQDDRDLFEKYMKRGDSIHEKLKRGKDTTLRSDSAINAYNTAMLIFPKYADSARKGILKVFGTLDSLKMDAIKQKNLAKIATDKAIRATDTAVILKLKADSAKQKLNAYNLANAPYKYIRLIRDGPIDKGKILKDSFELKLIAYADHLDTLKDRLDTMPVEKAVYAALRENLYYDNDLYEKLYYCFDAQDSVKNILEKVNMPPDLFRKRSFADNGSGFTLASKKLIPHKMDDRAKISALDTEVYTSFALCNNPKRLIGATIDHYIYVYNINDSSHGNESPEKIPMGAQVTALDFDEKNNTIFFGTESGDIGFIPYNGDKKNQPVYDLENSLRSPITAMDVFEYGTETFLLATGQAGIAVVYKLDNNFNVPNNKFYGNILPNKDLGDIDHAFFDADTKRVILETSKDGVTAVYSWDPFTESVLKKYKASMKKNEKNIELMSGILARSKFY